MGVEGGRSVRWTVPWPGVEVVEGKGEGITAGGLVYGGMEWLCIDSIMTSGLRRDVDKATDD